MEARNESHIGDWIRRGPVGAIRISMGTSPRSLMLVAAPVVHLWWLPRHGINGLTGEPKDKYYEFRGWNRHS